MDPDVSEPGTSVDGVSPVRFWDVGSLRYDGTNNPLPTLPMTEPISSAFDGMSIDRPASFVAPVVIEPEGGDTTVIQSDIITRNEEALVLSRPISTLTISFMRTGCPSRGRACARRFWCD